MDRELRIRMFLKASDQVTKPLRDIAGGSRAATHAVKEISDRLKQLDQQQSKIDGFRKMRVGLKETTGELAAVKTRIAEMRAAIGSVDNPTKKMTAELARAETAAGKLATKQREQAAALRSSREGFRQTGISVRDLASHESELRTSIERTNSELAEQNQRLLTADARAQRFGAARRSFGRVQGMATGLAAGGAAGIATGMTIARPLTGAVKEAQEYQSVMTDIAQKAGLSRVQAAAMGKELLVAARAANQMPTDMQTGVDTLMGFGKGAKDAAAMMKPIGRAATAYKAEIGDLAAAAFAANDNLKVPVQQTARVIDIMAAAGKAGAFEVKDMAGAFPALTAGYQALGQTGVGAVADLSAALQIARKGAGDSATAANNVANIIQKITSPSTIKAFDKMGINLPNALKKAYAEGKTPLEAIAELTRKATGGDLGKIGFLFEDSQVQQGLRPLIQNMEEYRKIRAEAGAASGTTDTDFAERMKDSAEQAKRLKIQGTALAINMGTVLLPTVNAIVEKAGIFADRLANLSQRHPMLTKVVLIGAAALTGLFLVLGAGAIALAAFMGPIAIVNAGLIAMGVSGGIASIGLLPIIGTVLAVVAVVALLAAGAYLIYKNWGAIGGFFTDLWTGIQTRLSAASDAVNGIFRGMWSGVKSVFSMSLFEVYQSIAYFVGYALGSLVRFGSAALAWLTGTLPGIFATGWNTAWSALTGALSASWAWLTTRLPAMLRGGWNAAWNAFKAALRAAFVTLPAMFYDFGSMIITGLWNGIKSAPGRLWNRGIALAKSLAGGFQAGAKIRSPSRVFMALGGHIIGGLNVGLDDGHDSAVGRIRRLTRNMAAAAALPAIAAGALVGPTVATAETVAARGRNVKVIDTRTRSPIAAAGPNTRATDREGAANGYSPPVYQITVHAAPGMDEQSVARAVVRELDRRERDVQARRRSTYRDDADGADQ
ncbi:MAG: phage tail tape measure protein [Pseudomonadota bacterium]